jgi:hypothetical protein
MFSVSISVSSEEPFGILALPSDVLMVAEAQAALLTAELAIPEKVPRYSATLSEALSVVKLLQLLIPKPSV